MTNILASTKKLFGGTAHTRFVAVVSGFTCLIAAATSANATQFKEARVTQVVNDVKLLLQQAAPRPAVVTDLVHEGIAVRTGTQSRSELTFPDLTLTRLGANTIFSFNRGTREMNLILLGSLSQSQAPLASANFIPPPPATLNPSASGFAWKGHSVLFYRTVNPSRWVQGKWSPQTARAFRKY
ncbi:MAG: hypothetical protein E6K60_06340 [Nitrospirae bacterium]|nr:MAG: hypothetical protein E6K60_06340 [Nitrospirota bacterium]